jgi:hypothetical protein
MSNSCIHAQEEATFWQQHQQQPNCALALKLDNVMKQETLFYDWSY